jgi:hypothetical protein
LNVPFNGEGKRRHAEQARRLNIKEEGVFVSAMPIWMKKKGGFGNPPYWKR